jgi:hypothetical protein
MPDKYPTPLSKKAGTTDLFEDDRLPLLRTAAREPLPGRRNPTIGINSVAKKIGDYMPGSNFRKGGPFYVRWYYERDKVDTEDTCLEELLPKYLCLNCRAFVEVGPQTGEWKLVYDTSPTALQVFRDGSFTVGIGGKWVRVDSQEAAEEAVEFFNAAKERGYYGPGDTEPQSVVRYTLNGVIGFYAARKRLTINGSTLIPFPTGASDDPNWQPVAAPQPPSGAGEDIDLSDITEFRDRFGDSFSGGLYEFAKTLLVKFQEPQFNDSLTLADKGSQVVEVGTVFTTGSKLVKWSTSNSQNVQTNSVTFRDVTANTILASGKANNGSFSVTTQGFTVSKGLNRVYLISAVNIKGSTFSDDMTISGLYNSYYGLSTKQTLTMADILALGNAQLLNGYNRSMSGVTAGPGQYFYFCWEDNDENDQVQFVIYDGVENVRGAFGDVQRVSGNNALGQPVKMAFLRSNATQAFSNNTLEFK